jgi:hypothetical protein
MGSFPHRICCPVSAAVADGTQARPACDKMLERFSRHLMRKYADQYYFGEPVTA